MNKMEPKIERDNKGRFVKGCQSYKGMLGKHHSQEAKRKISEGIKKHFSEHLETGRKTWVAEEIEIMNKHYPCTVMKGMLRLLPNRSASAIQNAAHMLNLYKTDVCRSLTHQKKVSLTPTRELAYILGAVLGDGCTIVQRKWGNYYTVLAVTSEEFARSFAEATRKIGLHPYIYRQQPHQGHWGKKTVFVVKAFSKRLVSFIRSLTFLELKSILSRKERSVAFLRGFYEAEGSRNKRGGISISNSDKELLTFVSECMDKIGISANVKGPYVWATNRKPMFLIQVGKTKANKFLETVKPTIKCGGG